ncbi:MAG: hypothetical protein HY757_06685 [Nitrospirae bacterium]|nr:hypothetical protein [Nitrospirota bacterium]
MGRRQKIILIIYVYAVVFLGFIYVPYVRHFPNGVRKFIGHHFRIKLIQMYPWEIETAGAVTIDANLIIAELFSITAIAVVAFLLFKREK